jgi:8-oxo-dGTP pyrophosphatase MutT (NUDIX family)
LARSRFHFASDLVKLSLKGQAYHHPFPERKEIVMAPPARSRKGMKVVRQSGVLALTQEGVCLVTNGSGKAWTIPKGHAEPDLSLSESALVEAYEEAGVLGVVEKEPLGSYVYTKEGKPHLVLVYVLYVSQTLNHWPEMKRRSRAFLSPRHALERIGNPGLKAIVEKCEAHRKWEKHSLLSKNPTHTTVPVLKDVAMHSAAALKR